VRRRIGALGRKLRQSKGKGILGAPVSRVVAPTLALGAGIGLVTRPLPNGDGWIGRAQSGYGYFQNSGNPMDLLATDPAGNNVFSILSYQIENNAGSALITAVEAALLGKLGRWAGM
jgi:hypothetical protein